MLLVDEMSIQTWIFTKNKDQIKYDKKMYVIIFIWSCLLRVTIHIDSISITVSFILRKRFHILFYDIFKHLKSAEHEIDYLIIPIHYILLTLLDNQLI